MVSLFQRQENKGEHVLNSLDDELLWAKLWFINECLNLKLVHLKEGCGIAEVYGRRKLYRFRDIDCNEASGGTVNVAKCFEWFEQDWGTFGHHDGVASDLNICIDND